MQLLLRSLVIWGIISLAWPVQSQVWPGDINDNGEVNSVDVLYWALANGSSGPLRANGSLYWLAQDAGPDWAMDFPDGQNLQYADCNGDGLVDLVDRIVINLNQDSSHAPYLGEDFSSGTVGEAPQVWLGATPDQDLQTVLGSTLSIPLHLGTFDLPLENCFGLAFRFEVDATLVNLPTPVIEKEEDDWLALESVLSIMNPDPQFQEEEQEGREVAWHLVDPNATVSGFGKIGDLKLIIEDDLTFLQTDTTVVVKIIPLRLVNNQLTTLEIARDTMNITIFRDSSLMLSTREESLPAEELTIRAYPNPTADQLLLTLDGEAMETITIYDVLGRATIRLAPPPGSEQQRIDVHSLPTGRYCLQVTTSSGKVIRSDFIKIDSR